MKDVKFYDLNYLMYNKYAFIFRFRDVRYNRRPRFLTTNFTRYHTHCLEIKQSLWNIAMMKIPIFFRYLYIKINISTHLSFFSQMAYVFIDDNFNLFQIGRSSESPIDFVVMDTVPGNRIVDKVCLLMINEDMQ